MALAPAIYATSTDAAFFTLLTIDPADSSPILRVVNNLEAVVSRGQTFEAFPFSLILQGDDGETLPTLTIQIDNVDQRLVHLIRALQDPPTVKLELVLSTSPDVVDKTVDFLRLSDVTYDAFTVSGTLQQDSFLNMPAIDSVYAGNEFPDLVI